jgi:hypothetical protein
VGVLIAVILFFVYKKFTKKSEYVMPPPASDTTTSANTYRDNIDLCERTYINAMNAAGTNQTDKDTAMNTANACITSNVSLYYRTRCPFLPASGATSSAAFSGITYSASGAPDGVVNGTSNTHYVAYKTAIDAITNAYLPYLSGAGQTSSALIIQAARKADFTGATRRYLSVLCPDFYTNATSSTDTIRYTNWSTSNTSYGFDSTKVTKARIWEWAKYAGIAPSTASGYAAPTSPLLASTPGALTKAGVTTCSFGTDGAVAWSNGAWNANAAWQLAADNGPGTVNTYVTLPWSSVTNSVVDSKCPVGSGTYIDTATTSNPLP